MVSAALIVFLLSYTGIAIGAFPGLALDRTGIALLGAIAMVALRVLPTGQALAAIDTSTILLLYALMVISSQFRLSGFYTHTASRVARLVDRPRLFLWALLGVTALLSALLTNDIVCLAFTPVICAALAKARRNPLPYLLGLAIASNIGSAATIIGNPQNMLLGQVGDLPFAAFLIHCLPPTLLSLGGAGLLLMRLFRAEFTGEPSRPPARPAAPLPPYDRHQARKGMAVTAALLVLLFTPLPRELSALVLAGILLCSRRMTTRKLLGGVDWHLITLFCALFVLIAGIATTGLPDRFLTAFQNRGGTGVGWLILLTTVLSNLVSNVPAVMLLTRLLPAGDFTAWIATALASTFAGNLVTIGSIANLIVIEGAREHGVKISFWDHARVGVPVTACSLLITYFWLR